MSRRNNNFCLFTSDLGLLYAIVPVYKVLAHLCKNLCPYLKNTTLILRVKKLSQWYYVLFCSLLYQFQSKSHDLEHFWKLICYIIICIIFRLLCNLFDLSQANHPRMAKHWDSFLTHCKLLKMMDKSEQ